MDRKGVYGRMDEVADDDGNWARDAGLIFDARRADDADEDAGGEEAPEMEVLMELKRDEKNPPPAAEAADEGGGGGAG